ncbi:MAG: Lrp/AsnC family transcriptional regulator [Rhodospirillales bacterium]|nr:Lrp/AsnC family transcriptional regulator [Rhodospirillales bacterium]
MDATDRRLIQLLEADARLPTAALARQLGLARSTVQERLSRLERSGAIAGYTVKLGDDIQRRQIVAHVMIDANPKLGERIVGELRKLPEVKRLYAVSGIHDLIAVAVAETTQDMDALLDRIGRIPGIEKTVSSIVLSAKFDR